MIENLVIVESPAKAKTIEKFLGKDYIVKSSFGHIRDLAKKNLGIDIENQFEPNYEISVDKRKVVSELKKLVKDANTIWLASDEDREGEAIAWHLYEVLGLKKKETKRIVFHEITKQAISNAIKNPRTIDQKLVDAQQARRILDRIVGFEISPVLWRKVKPSLSAGRVQSVAVRLIVEREREILDFKSKSTFKVTADFLKDDGSSKISATLSDKLPNEKSTRDFLESCKDAEYKIEKIEVKPSKKSPSAPFTTSTLQQEASRKLGFSVSQTMSVAQRLYEAGYITYMRTDSVNLSEAALNAAKAQIINMFGEEYSKPRHYKTKAKGAQEAHEAIRPSYMDREIVSDNHQEQRLYELIRKRTLASQMSDAKLEKTNALISISTSDKKFIASGEVIKFDGFLKLYIESTDDEENKNGAQGLLPPLKEGEILNAQKIKAIERFSNHPPRFTEASLVRKLEELGIGRPSTYAPTISTIQNRGYVLKENREGTKRNYKEFILTGTKIDAKVKSEIAGSEKSKLFPTDIGMVVNDFLIKHFDKIMDFNFTAKVEKEFDEIAQGKMVWNKMISRFYSPFHKNVEVTLETSEREQGERLLGKHPETGKPVIVKIGRFGPMVQVGESNTDEKPQFASLRKEQLMEKITLEEALEVLKNSNEGRFLGNDPKTGKKITARIGRFGPMVQLGENNEGDEKPQYAALKKGQTVDSITLEDALELLKLPRKVGEYEGKTVTAAIGRFGPYLKYDDLFVSLKKTDDPHTVDIDRAIELIEEKKEANRKRLIKKFPDNKDLKIMKDRWGNPCVYYKKKYYRISAKIKKPEELKADDCLKIAEEGKKIRKRKNKH